MAGNCSACLLAAGGPAQVQVQVRVKGQVSWVRVGVSGACACVHWCVSVVVSLALCVTWCIRYVTSGQKNAVKRSAGRSIFCALCMGLFNVCMDKGRRGRSGEAKVFGNVRAGESPILFFFCPSGFC